MDAEPKYQLVATHSPLPTSAISRDLFRRSLETPALWPDSLLRGLLVRLFPQHIKPDRLCAILRRVQESPNTLDEFEWMLPRSIAEEKCSPGYMEQLRSGLTSLVIEGLEWKDEWPHLASDRSHLLSALAAVCLRLIKEGRTDPEVLHSAVVALRLTREDRSQDEPTKNLRVAIGGLAPPLRESVFWAEDAFNQSLHPESDPWRRVFNATYYGALQLNGVLDSAWIRRILADADRPIVERRMMVEIAVRGGWDGDVRELRRYVGDEQDLIAAIDRYLTPPAPDSTTAKLEARFSTQRRATEKREAKRHADWMAFWKEVANHPDTAFSPGHQQGTAFSLWQAMQRSGDESRASGWNRRFIEEHFGKKVADQLRQSMLSIWRQDRPTLRSERPQDKRGTFLVRWQLGLAAIAAEAEDPNWAEGLSVEEARLAARFAPIELNGFPVWLESLSRRHPGAVEETLGPELSAELDEVASQNHFCALLQNLDHAPKAVLNLFVPRLRTWLDANANGLREGESEAAAFNRLYRVVKILLAHGDEETRRHIKEMAEGILENSQEGPYTQIWLATLLRLDSSRGIDVLEQLLSPHAPDASGFPVEVFGSLFGDRHSDLRVNLRGHEFTPAGLLRLARLAYRYVRLSDDVTHEGTYTPGVRDHAQSGRSAIISAILDSAGPEAWAVKVEMAADPMYTHFSDRLFLLAREKEAERADGAVFTEAEAATFDAYGEAPPTTRDDMFSLLVDRLEDLDDLLLQDVSPRAAWKPIKDEKVMRQQIARELRNASNHVYTVDQEAVTADEKETDIRLRVAASGQQGTIELKIGENWSGRELRETIKSQLVMRYMAAESCRSGCLLVTVASDKGWEHPDNGEKLDFEGLRKMLNAEAVRVAEELGGQVRLVAKILDLRPRLRRQSSLKKAKSASASLVSQGHRSGPSRRGKAKRRGKKESKAKMGKSPRGSDRPKAGAPAKSKTPPKVRSSSKGKPRAVTLVKKGKKTTATVKKRVNPKAKSKTGTKSRSASKAKR